MVSYCCIDTGKSTASYFVSYHIICFIKRDRKVSPQISFSDEYVTLCLATKMSAILSLVRSYLPYRGVSGKSGNWLLSV